MLKRGFKLYMTNSVSPEGSEPELPEPEQGFGGLDDEIILALNSFDRERGQLHDAISTTAVDLPELEVYKAELSLLGSLATRALGNYVEAALVYQERGAVKEDLLQLWRQDDTERTSIFTGIFEGDECFEPFRPGSLEKLVDDIFVEDTDTDNLPGTVTHVYGDILGDELSLFAEHTEKLREMKFQEAEEAEYSQSRPLSHIARSTFIRYC